MTAPATLFTSEMLRRLRDAAPELSNRPPSVDIGQLLNDYAAEVRAELDALLAGAGGAFTSIDAAIGSNQNDWAPTGLDGATRIVITPSGALTITGIAAATFDDGDELELVNDSTTIGITLANESASSTAANRFTFADAIDVALRPSGSVVLRYDSAQGRWRQRAGGQILRPVPVVFLASGSLALSITNAQVELGAAVHRRDVDFSGCVQVYFEEAHATGNNAGTKFGPQYSVDGGVTWFWADGVAAASAPSAYVDITNPATQNLGGPFTLATAARARARWKPMFLDGGSTSHNLRMVAMWGV